MTTGEAGEAGTDLPIEDPLECPACGAPMARQEFDGNYDTTVLIDICRGCRGLWFDAGESLRLSPGATLRLFRLIHEHPAEERNQLPDALRCSRCGERLIATTDRQHNTPFYYARCPREEGRFITFFQFLREKNFVRSLDPRELKELRARLRSVACSNCGAPVDLERAPTCSYCRAPLSVLDPRQIERALGELQRAEARRPPVEAAVRRRWPDDRHLIQRALSSIEGPAVPASGGGRSLARHGLVEVGIAALLEWLGELPG